MATAGNSKNAKKKPAPAPKPADSVDVFQCCNGTDGSHTHGPDPHRRGSAWSITNMPAEIAELAIDRPVNRDVKADDMKRHVQDESLDAFQRALLCLESTEPIQKIFAAQSIFSLIQQDEKRAFMEIIPAIENEFKKNKDPEFHFAASSSTTKAINELLKKNPARGKQLAQMAAALAASGDSVVSDSWYTCFDTLADLLGTADLQRELVPQITERFGNAGSNVNSKRIAAKLINKLTKRLPEEVVAKKFVPVVESLCKDADPMVRGTMCAHLPEVLVKLKDKKVLFPIINKFVSDTDPGLMAALTGALGKSATLINPKDAQTNEFFKIALPVLKKFVKKAYMEGDANVLIQFTSYMGQMASIFSGAGVLSDGDKLWFVDAYMQLSRYGLPPGYHKDKDGIAKEAPTGFVNFRANMTFNRRHSLIETLISSGTPKTVAGPGFSPAATLALLKGNKGTNNNNVGSVNKPPPGHHKAFSLSAAADNEDGWHCRGNAASQFFHFLKFAEPMVGFSNGLHSVAADLMHDPHPAVRAKMAENLYPIMEHLGPKQGAHVLGEVVYCLNDENSVVEAIMPHLADIMKILVTSKTIGPDLLNNEMVEIGGALLFCEERLSQTTDWRLHSMLLEQLAILPFCLPGDYVYSNFVPSLFHRLLHMRQLPCRIAAADVIVTFLRHCRRAEQREEIRKKITKAFAQGTNVHDRMLFLNMSKRIMELFSRKYYRDNFFETTLSMADDNVPNVRMKTVTLMPDMKGALQMAESPTLLQKLEETLQRIKRSETDRDVQNAIDVVIPEMAKIGVVLKDDKKGPKTQADLEDEAKEREEAYIAALEPVGRKPTIKEKTASMYKTSKRHSEIAKAITLPPAPATPANPAPGSPAAAPPPSTPLTQNKVPGIPSTDNTKLALQMKGHTYTKPPDSAKPGTSRKSLSKEAPKPGPSDTKPKGRSK